VTKRQWHLRMYCTYQNSSNNISSLKVEQLVEPDQWKPLEINNDSPGFLIFIYSLFSCQHLYMYLNAAERGLELESTEGALELITTHDWKLETLRVNFNGKLRSGTATTEDIEDIQRRMNQCPVSRNIVVSEIHDTQLQLH